jgi:hypothetical protein
MSYELDPLFEMDGFLVRRCMRSGLCCTTNTCGEGLKHGAEPKGCKFLRGDGPGAYACGLVEDDPEQKPIIGVGWGCCACPSGTKHEPCSCCEKADRSLETLGTLLGKEFISSDVIYFMLCGLKERGMQREAAAFLQGFAKARNLETHKFMG